MKKLIEVTSENMWISQGGHIYFTVDAPVSALYAENPNATEDDLKDYVIKNFTFTSRVKGELSVTPGYCDGLFLRLYVGSKVPAHLIEKQKAVFKNKPVKIFD